MKKLLCFIVAALLPGCASFNGGSGLSPAVVGSQTTVLVQGAELLLQNNPAALAEFESASVAVGGYLVQLSQGGVVVPVATLQTLLQDLLVSRGISTTNSSAISKIVVAEYTLIADQFGFNGTVTIPSSVNTAQVNALLAAVGTSLEQAQATAAKIQRVHRAIN